jgi:hypothetical protein
VALGAFAKFYKEAVPGLIAFLRLLGASYPVAADCDSPIWRTDATIVSSSQGLAGQLNLDAGLNSLLRTTETPDR